MLIVLLCTRRTVTQALTANRLSQVERAQILNGESSAVVNCPASTLCDQNKRHIQACFLL